MTTSEKRSQTEAGFISYSEWNSRCLTSSVNTTSKSTFHTSLAKLKLLKSPSQHIPEFNVHHELHIKSHNKQALNVFLFQFLNSPPNKWYRLLTFSYNNPAEFPFWYNILSQPNDSAACCKTKCLVWSLYITPNGNSRLPESFQAGFQPEFHIRPDSSVEDLMAAPGQKDWASSLSRNTLFFFFFQKVLSSGCLGAFPRQELTKKNQSCK